MTLTTQIHIYNAKNETAELIWEYIANLTGFPLEKYEPLIEDDGDIVKSPFGVGAKAWVKVEKPGDSRFTVFLRFPVPMDSKYVSNPEATHNKVVLALVARYPLSVVIARNEYTGGWVVGGAPYAD